MSNTLINFYTTSEQSTDSIKVFYSGMKMLFILLDALFKYETKYEDVI